MSVNGVSPALTSPIGYDRAGHPRGDGSRAETSARTNAEAMRVEISPAAKGAAARAAVTQATAEAAASADVFAGSEGAALLARLAPRAHHRL